MEVDRAIESVLRDSVIHKKDRKDIVAFVQYLRATQKTNARIIKYLYALRTISKYLKISFRDAKRPDIERTVAELESNKYSDWTKRDFRIILKLYMKWIRGMADEEGYPEEVKWLKTPKKKGKRLPEEILTQEEVTNLAKNTTNVRDRAFVLGLYESGTRIGEFINLQIKHVEFDEYGCVLIVSGKTGDRRVRLVVSSPAFAEWIQSHPFKHDPKSFVWVGIDRTNPYKSISYEMVCRTLKNAKKRAGITKRINPHAFRHARATHLANFMTESQMKELFGWQQDSGMVATYVHLSGRDVDQAILRQHGITTSTNNNGNSYHHIALKECSACNAKNDPATMFCIQCKTPMDLSEKRKQMDNLVFEFLSILAEENPRIKEKWVELVKKRGNKIEGVFG